MLTPPKSNGSRLHQPEEADTVGRQDADFTTCANRVDRVGHACPIGGAQAGIPLQRESSVICRPGQIHVIQRGGRNLQGRREAGIHQGDAG